MNIQITIDNVRHGDLDALIERLATRIAAKLDPRHHQILDKESTVTGSGDVSAVSSGHDGDL